MRLHLPNGGRTTVRLDSPQASILEPRDAVSNTVDALVVRREGHAVSIFGGNALEQRRNLLLA